MRIPQRWNKMTRWLHLAAASLLMINLLVIVAWPLVRQTAAREPLAAMYAALCHQMPSRSLQLAGEPMPVCARCLGIWAGLALAAALRAAGRARWKTVTACCLLAVLVVDWCLDYAGLPAAWHLKRTITGTLGGIGLYLLTAQLIRWALRGRRAVGSYQSAASKMFL